MGPRDEVKRALARVSRTVAAAVLAVAAPASAAAQGWVDGYASVQADALPHVAATKELRARGLARRTLHAGDRFTFELAGAIEALAADRSAGTRRVLTGSVEDLYVDVAWQNADVRAGVGRIVWGRLDELQPSDIINPLDVARFFFEGRSEARLSVGFARARVFLPGETVVEGVVVPLFRRGTFDRLDEAGSPFNLGPPAAVVHEPARAWKNVQGGARVSGTIHRFDWSASAYRGLESFPVYAAAAGPGGVAIEGTFPRFSMLAADFETVRGEWGVRGEVAFFLDDNFQVAAPSGPSAADGRALDAGVGVDRRAGNYRVSGVVLMTLQSAGAAVDATDLTLVGVLDRQFARETRALRLFGVYNPEERSLFLRSIASLSLRDDLWIEGSIGWFLGEGDSLIGRFADRDFVYARLKVYF
jgi:hypothetical protein